MALSRPWPTVWLTCWQCHVSTLPFGVEAALWWLLDTCASRSVPGTIMGEGLPLLPWSLPVPRPRSWLEMNMVQGIVP